MPGSRVLSGAALVLKIFLALLPTLLAFMNKKQGMIAASKVDFGVVRKYFIFQVCSLFVMDNGTPDLVLVTIASRSSVR